MQKMRASTCIHQQFYRSADRAFCRIVLKTYQKLAKNVLDILEKTSPCCIRSVPYVLYVLKPAKRADFSMISRFVNFLMLVSSRECDLA